MDQVVDLEEEEQNLPTLLDWIIKEMQETEQLLLHSHQVLVVEEVVVPVVMVLMLLTPQDLRVDRLSLVKVD